MILTTVTLTGADDSVEPRELARLSAEFPYVEWGILFSGTHQGSPRFPSVPWMRELLAVADDAAEVGRPLNLCAHLCGKWVRELVLEGEFSWKKSADGYGWFWPICRRIQLNFHGRWHQQASTFQSVITDHANHFGRTFILQCDGVNDEAIRAIADSDVIVPLFDTSGGAGVLPTKWPAPWPGVYCGYAGGLGPENIVEQLHAIADVVVGQATIWVDMERKIRSEDDVQFDLAKVRTVLEQTAPYASEQPATTA